MSPLPKVKKTLLPSVTGEGEAVGTRLVGDALITPTATVLRQSSLPVLRSMQIASRSFVFASVELTKTLSSQTIGVAALGPGSGAAQTTFSVLLHDSGSPLSVLDPLKEGPRHCGQFSA